MRSVRDQKLRALSIADQVSEKHWPNRCLNCGAPFMRLIWESGSGFRCLNCGAKDDTGPAPDFQEAITDPEFFQEALFGR